MIHLGYEVGTGKPVVVPVNHTIITGQTQMAGKTTTLEAMIERSGYKALAFLTKRGEGGFANSRRIAPFFKEQADWKYVAAILEASRGEKLKFERAWIIRASKGARTLAEVQRNVREALKTAKGMSADVYLTLEAYLEDVVPQISRVMWATSIDLRDGVNVMDLTGVSQDMQHLVIRSSLEWVLNREENTIVVVPEAWKFIPQGRGTPVKLAAESYIRQAAGLKNYLWLDSQDIAGIEKIILKSVPLWILGVQREANEIKRTIANIPPGIKRPKTEQISTLDLGQFYGCWGREIVHTYVQPVWMDESTARRIALGEVAVPARIEPIAQEARLDHPIREEKEEPMNEDQFDAMMTGFARLENAIRASRQLPAVLEERLSPPADSAATPLSGPSVNDASRMDENVLYQRIKQRLMDEAPAVWKVLAERGHEVVVGYERPTVTVDGKSLRGRIALLLAEGEMDKPTGVTPIWDRVSERGEKVERVQVAAELNAMADDGLLVRSQAADRTKLFAKAPDVTVVRRER